MLWNSAGYGYPTTPEAVQTNVVTRVSTPNDHYLRLFPSTPLKHNHPFTNSSGKHSPTTSYRFAIHANFYDIKRLSPFAPSRCPDGVITVVRYRSGCVVLPCDACHGRVTFSNPLPISHVSVILSSIEDACYISSNFTLYLAVRSSFLL